MMDYNFGEPDPEPYEDDGCTPPYEPTVEEINRNGDRDFYHAHETNILAYTRHLRFKHKFSYTRRYMRIGFNIFQYQWFYTSLIPSPDVHLDVYEVTKDIVIDFICLGRERFEQEILKGWEIKEREEDFAW